MVAVGDEGRNRNRESFLRVEGDGERVGRSVDCVNYNID